MNTFQKSINNEHGFVLVTSLLMLTILMIIGIAATNTTTIELQISGNDKLAKQTFYQAESEAYRAAQQLDNRSDESNPDYNLDELRPSRSNSVWLFEEDKEAALLTDETQWRENPTNPSSAIMPFVAISLGRVKGGKASSLKMTAKSVYAYHLYGRSAQNNAQKIIEIGCKYRF